MINTFLSVYTPVKDIQFRFNFIPFSLSFQFHFHLHKNTVGAFPRINLIIGLFCPYRLNVRTNNSIYQDLWLSRRFLFFFFFSRLRLFLSRARIRKIAQVKILIWSVEQTDCHSNLTKRKEEFDFPCFLSSFFSFLLSFFHVLNGVLDDYLDQ